MIPYFAYSSSSAFAGWIQSALSPIEARMVRITSEGTVNETPIDPIVLFWKDIVEQSNPRISWIPPSDLTVEHDHVRLLAFRLNTTKEDALMRLNLHERFFRLLEGEKPAG